MCRSRDRARSARARGPGRGAVRRPARCAANFQGPPGRRRTGCQRSAGTTAGSLSEQLSALGLPSAQLMDEGGVICQQFLASPVGTLSQRQMLEMRLIGPLRHRLGSVQAAFDSPGRPGYGGTEHRRTPPSAVVSGKARRSGSRRGGEAPGADHRSTPGPSVRGCRVLVSCPTLPIAICSTVYAGAGQPLDSSWNARGRRNRLPIQGQHSQVIAGPRSVAPSPHQMQALSRGRDMATAAASSDGGRRDARFGTDMSRTDLDLKADAYRLLVCMNYSKGIDAEVLGISGPEAPESARCSSGGALPVGCTH